MDNLATVAICTYNRCETLAQTLNALQAQQIAGFTFDILVVDNASTDKTSEVVTSFQNSVIPIHYVFEAQQGVANARNRALEIVEAPIIAFLDDDVIPDPNWLSVLVNGFNTIHPQPAAVGGRIWLRWTQGQPNWLPDELLGVYSKQDYGDNIRTVTMLNGANVAFLTKAIQRYRYATQLGVHGGNQTPGEDAEILMQMRRDGHSLYYQPAAVVWHLVGRYRENRSYLFRRSHGLGHAQALFCVIDGWPGRYAIMKMMLLYVMNHRHWWRRIFMSLVTGKMLFSPRERTWVQSILIRVLAFQRQMLIFALKGTSENN
jgi:glucosyl-dolichyl phosphate glucuronosyltransferase